MAFWGANYGGSSPRAGNLPQDLSGYASYIKQFPGAAPGGSGYTGLAPGDRLGWERLQQLGQAYTGAGGRTPNFRVSGGEAGGGLNLPRVSPPSGVAARPRSGSSGSAGGGMAGAALMDLIPGAQRAHLGYQLGQEAIGESKQRQVAGTFDPMRALEAQMAQRLSDPRMAAMQGAGIQQDVADLASQRGADRYFSPGEKGMRADVRGNAMQEILNRYLLPAQMEAGVETRGQDIDAMTSAAEIEQRREQAGIRGTTDAARAVAGYGEDELPPWLLQALQSLLGAGGGGVPPGGGAGGGGAPQF